MTTVTLRFRAGVADETYSTTGLGHLVEHLVMRQLPRTTATVNASVDPEYTQFFARGPAPEVAAFVRDTCRAICALVDGVSDEDLEREKRVLAAEDQGGDPSSIPLAERFGFVGHGLPSIGPVGLRSLTSAHVAHWVSRLLVVENCVLTVQGPWPPLDDVELPSGRRNERPLTPRVPGPFPRQLPLHSFPFTVVGFEFDGQLSAGGTARVITEKLESHLRATLGRSYAVGMEQRYLDHATRHVSFVMDAAPGEHRSVAAEALGELKRLMHDGPEQSDLDHDAAALEALLLDPEFADSLLYTASHRLLAGSGDPSEDARSEVARLRERTPDDVREHLRRAVPSLVVVFSGPETLTAAECHADPPFPAYPCVGEPVAGTKLSRRLLGGAPRGIRMVYNDHAVGYLLDDIWHSIPYDDIVGLGVDGDVRHVAGASGCALVVDPEDFKGTEQLVRLLDSRAPVGTTYDATGLS